MARLPRAAVDQVRRLLFHGSGKEFDQFDPQFIGSGDGASFQGRGFYFTPDEQMAEKYARDQAGGGGIVVDFGGGFKTSPDEFDDFLRDMGADDDVILRARQHLDEVMQRGEMGPLRTGDPSVDEWIEGATVVSRAEAQPTLYEVLLDPQARLLDGSSPVDDPELLEFLARQNPRVTPDVSAMQAYGFAGSQMGEDVLNTELLNRGIHGIEIPPGRGAGGQAGTGGVVTIFDPSVLQIQNRRRVE